MKIRDVIGLSNAKLIMGDENYEFLGFSKDTRTIGKGDTYIGIKGENFDGNIFFKDAFLNGADTCVLEHIDFTEEIEKKFAGKNIILTDNAVDFIMAAARKKREEIKVPVIAITGSVGKTSTKAIVADTLEQKYSVLRTIGNENSRIGMSLRILNYNNEECIVLEMGMNHAGEIHELTNIAKPDVAVITNVGTSHIGNLGSRENILKAKLEIIDGLNGPLIINNDNDLLNEWYNKHEYENIITFGIKNKSDYQALNVTYENDGTNYIINGENLHIPVIGDAFIYNSLVAFIMGNLFKVRIEDIKQVLLKIKTEPHRMEFINVHNYTIIDDSYNASYDSVAYALEVLKNFKERKIFVLGDIFELGEFDKEIHCKIGKLITNYSIDILVTVGDLSKYVNEEAIRNGFNINNSFHFENNAEVIGYLKKTIINDDIVLIKASHGMNFIEIVNNLVN